MNNGIEGDKPKTPEPGEAETVTITLEEYNLLRNVANTVVNMGKSLEDFKKPKTELGFQPPNARINSSDSEPEI